MGKMTRTKRTQRDRYGDDVIDDGQDAIDKCNDACEGDAMTYNEEDLEKAADAMLDQLDELHGLRAERDQVAKSLDALLDDMTWQAMDTRRVSREVRSTQAVLAKMYRQDKRNRQAIVGLAKAFEGFCGLLTRAAAAPRHQGVAALTKSLMPRGSSRAELVQAAQVLTSWFGEKGGQPLRYDRELASQLIMAKSLSCDELERWQKWNRLPDRINLRDPGRSPTVDWQDAGTTQLMQAPAGMGACALGMEALARQARR